MRVLLTGADGYLGCLLGPRLLQEGHDVVGVDTGFFRTGELYRTGDPRPLTLTRDVRDLDRDDLEGVDAVVHAGELSNDPLGELLADVTPEVNHRASVRLARLAKEAGAQRFVQMSSCSVYGIADGTVDETSPVAPLTAYARCKALVERDLTALADDGFSPTFLRNATAFGASPRMRFDLVVNNLAGAAATTGEVTVHTDGSPWRPLVHARDIGSAVLEVLRAPREDVHAQALNIGHDEANHTVRDIAETVAAAFPGSRTRFGSGSPDERSYRVSFAKVREVLPGFRCAWSVADGARELASVFAAVGLDEATFRGRGHTRLLQLRHLLDTTQVDDDLRWNAP